MTEYIEAGSFSVDTEARTVKGLLLPWGETSRMSASQTQPISFERGTVTVPADISILTANRFHNQHDPVGRATSVEDTDAGLVATFSIARNPEGDEFLDQYKAGTIRKLSAELAGIVRDGAKGVKARLTGAGFVTEGAFASAALFAIGDPEDVADKPSTEPKTTVDERTEKFTDEDGKTWNRKVTTTTVIDGDTTTVTTKEVLTEPELEPDPNPEEAQVAPVPATLNASLEAKPEETANGVFELIRKMRAPMGDAEAETMLAALADIKTSGTGALPASGVIQPAWLGEVWAERTYERRYWGLVKNGSITAQDEKGFRMDSAAELVQAYAGNKADMPTGTATTSLVSSTFQRWAVAVDIAREFFDIPGNREVIDAFVRRLFNSYARVTDKWALQQYVAAAGTAVSADVFPDGYNTSIGKLLQGINVINDTDVDASFVVVAPDVHKELLYTPKDKIPEFINLSAGFQSGTADGIQVVRDKFGVLSAGQVLVGSKDSAHVNEMAGGSPLTLDALDIARGGIDKAVHGYTQYLTEYTQGFVLLKTRTA